MADFLDLLDPGGNAGRWVENSQPLHTRGVRWKWLVEFANRIVQVLNEPRQSALQEAERAEQQNRAAMWRDDVPFTTAPIIPAYRVLTCHGLASLVRAVTKSLGAPLYALVPNEHRGVPSVFVSHVWSSLLLGPDRQRVGSLDVPIEDEFVWIDFACYNQHVVHESRIATDMRALIERIGKVAVCTTPTPIYSRAWCLWELFCAHQIGVPLSFEVRRGFRNDKILAVNAIYRSFQGIARVQSTNLVDQRAIYDEVLAFFGTGEKADRELKNLIEEKFASEFFELQKRGTLRFSPAPWVFDTDGSTLGQFEPYWLPGILEAEVYGSEQTVAELFYRTNVALPPSIHSHLVQEDVARLPTPAQSFLADCQAGRLEGVTKAIRAGVAHDYQEGVGGLSPLKLASHNGHAAVVELLLSEGFDPNSETSDISALRLAAEKGFAEVVHVLVRGGASVNSANIDGWTALTFAAAGGRDQVALVLLDHGATVDCVSSAGATPLILAAKAGHARMVEILLSRGASIAVVTDGGNSALHFATHEGQDAVVALLVKEGARADQPNKDGRTALVIAKEAGRESLARLLLNSVRSTN